jgi:hypothetical protein
MSKSNLKATLAIVFCVIMAAVPATAFYLLWSWAMSQVAATLAYAGLIKVGITLVMVLFGGGFTIGLSFVLFTLSVALVAVLFD